MVHTVFSGNLSTTLVRYDLYVFYDHVITIYNKYITIRNKPQQKYPHHPYIQVFQGTHGPQSNPISHKLHEVMR